MRTVNELPEGRGMEPPRFTPGWQVDSFHRVVDMAKEIGQ
jgi:hypothetical protein